MARIIRPIEQRNHKGQNALNHKGHEVHQGSHKACFFLSALCVLCGSLLTAHDLERTQVSLTFAVDGSFVVDVANDPSWLRDRLQSIPGPFADRIVLWVDGRE